MEKYLVRYSSEQNVAEAWSTQRLPFEPQGWLIDLRNDIRKAIHSITSQHNQVLHAVYGAARSDSVCDVENILLYNVQTSHFSSLANLSIRFERCFSYPDPPNPLIAADLHYHNYITEAINKAFLHWQVGRTLAEWEDIKVPGLTTQTKVMDIWYCLKSNGLKTLYMPGSIPKQFGLTVTIKIPTINKVNVANLAKPLIDGIVSAFHVYKGSEVEPLSKRLASKMNKNTSTIADFLCRTDRAILGGRQVVRLRGSDGTTWDPADDLCLAAEIFAQPYSGKDWLISGKLYEILYKDLQY